MPVGASVAGIILLNAYVAQQMRRSLGQTAEGYLIPWIRFSVHHPAKQPSEKAHKSRQQRG